MKKILLSLFVWFVWIISFCSADVISIWMDCGYVWWTNVCWKWNLRSQQIYLNKWDYLIFVIDNNWNLVKDYSTFRVVLSDRNYTNILSYITWSNPFIQNVLNTSVVLSFVDVTFYWRSTNFNSEIYTIVLVPVSEFSSCSCDPQYTSEQCQSVYWLVSSWLLNTCQSDLNSCQSNTSWFNDLLNNCNSSLNACNSSLTSCLQNNCPVISWDIQWSSLYINDIQHEWSPIIDITLPEEISWDYSRDDNIFSVVVSWYNVDTDYIDWIIRTQNYKPTSEDFTQLVWMLAPYSKYLLFLLFIFIIWAWIKKPFKSKKL